MTLSTAQLETLYTNANEGWAPDAATQLLLAAYAQQTIGGGVTDAQALSMALHIPPPADGSVGDNTPESSVDVALGIYQFFTGMAPTLGGLDYLVNNDGGAPLNPNDLDSAYYAGFNQANRYYNFAINLITGNPVVAANFAATYGSATFDQVIVASYESIIGTPNVGSSAALAAIAAIEGQLSYFQEVAAERAPGVSLDLATKAIAIAYIIEEAVKADVGYYAFAIDAFNTITSGNPEAVIPGMTAGGIDLLTAFPIVTPGQTFVLTPGIDTINPPNTNNNTVVGTDLTFTPFDTINLGTTTGNVFNWSSTTTTGLFETVVPTDASVSDVQTFNINTISGVYADTTGFSGLQTLNADIFTYNGSELLAGPTTAINITYTDTGNETGELDVYGGSVVTIEQDNPHNYDPAFIYVQGGSGTTTVDIVQTSPDYDYGNIYIEEYYGTIANISVTGLDYNHVTIHGGLGLSNLTIADAYYSDVYINGFDGSPAALNLTLNNVVDLYVHDVPGSYTTLNVILDTGASLTPFFDAITSENISGTGVLSQRSHSNFLGELESITLSGAAGFFDENFSVQFLPELTSIDASHSSGTVTTTLNDEQTSFLGGAGTDFVIVFADATVPVTGGSAGNNEIVFNVDAADLTAGGTYANVTNFEILGTAFNSEGTYNLGGFAVPIANVDVRYNPDGALIFTGASSTQTLSIDASLTNPVTLIQGAAAAASVHNTLNLNIGVDVGFLGVSAHDGIDTSDIGTGFLNPVGTDVSVPLHTGTTDTTVTFNDSGADLTYWMDVLTIPTITVSGAELKWTDTTHGKVVDVTFSSNVVSTDLAFMASQINAGDPFVTATVSGDQLTVTSDTAGTAGNITAHFSTSTAGDYSGVTDVITKGVNASPDSGTITVSGVDTVPNQLNLSDSLGNLGPDTYIALTGGESAQTVANDIVTLLKADGFTGVSDGGGTTTTVSFTYPTAGEYGLTSTDTVAQVDTISLAGVSVASGDIFSETVNGDTVTYTAIGGDTPTSVAAALTGLINGQTGTTTVTATQSGTNIYLTEIVGDALVPFTSTQVNETTFTIDFYPFGIMPGSNAITANNYQTVNLDSEGTAVAFFGNGNTVYLVDNALTTLNVSGPEDLTLLTGGGHLLANIDTTGASGVVGLLGVGYSEVTTGITANLGDASVYLGGNANTGFTDIIIGGNGNDHIWGNGFTPPAGGGAGGNTDVTLGNGGDVVYLFNGSTNVVTLGNGGDVIGDFSNGNDTLSAGNGVTDLVDHTGDGNTSITLGNGAGDLVEHSGSGNDIIHVGNGAGDTVDTGTGMDTVVFGTGSGDLALLSDDTGGGHGITNITFGGLLATLNLSHVDDASFLTPTTTSQVQILTNNVNVVSGFVHGDTIVLPTAGDTLHTAINMAGVAGEALLTTGTESGGVFTYGAAGHDALLTYDSGAGELVSVVLVGGASEISHAVLVGNTITW